MGSGAVSAGDDLPADDCPQCGGTGGTGHTPNVTPEQRLTAETFRAKLENLKEPVFSNFPCKKKQVYLRLTYDGQIFIKEVKT
jgi:hypothetical protein